MIPEPAFHDLHLHRWSSAIWASVPSLCNGEGLLAQSCELPGQSIGDTPPGGVLVLLMLATTPQPAPRCLLPPTLHPEPFLPLSCTLLLSHMLILLYTPGLARGHLTDQGANKTAPYPPTEPHWHILLPTPRTSQGTSACWSLVSQVEIQRPRSSAWSWELEAWET